MATERASFAENIKVATCNFAHQKSAHRSAKKKHTVHCAPNAKSSIDGAAIVAADNFLINDADGGWMDEKSTR